MKAIVSDVKIQNTAFFDILSLEPGGAILDSNSQKKEIEVCEFQNVRTKTNDGGVIWKKVGTVSISKCCFEGCESGNKTNNAGGNVIWYDNAGIAFEYSLIFRCTDKKNPGDSPIISFGSNKCDIENCNFTRNYGLNSLTDKDDLYGNCVCEVKMDKAGTFKYSHIADSVAYRVIVFNLNANSAFTYSNVVNCSVNWFTNEKYTLRIQNCCIFKNTFRTKLKYQFQNCLSDDIQFCTKTTKQTLQKNDYGSQILCEAKIQTLARSKPRIFPVVMSILSAYQL